MSVALHGYKYSVYAWIARFALHQKGVEYQWVEVNPFAKDVPAEYLAMHPFCRVPALEHDGFALYETAAITRYVDEAFDGPALQPAPPEARARMVQIASVVDSYAYWPLVRQVFSHGYMGPRLDRPVDADAYRKGLNDAPRVLAALEALTGDSTFLISEDVTLADIHLAPMISYFVAARDGMALYKQYPGLWSWWTRISQQETFIETAPQLP